jgi:hypothetical protein
MTLLRLARGPVPEVPVGLHPRLGVFWGRVMKMVNHPNRRNGMRYVSSIPKSLSPGRVLVRNHVLPQLPIGLNGSRAWTQRMHEDLMVCPCE